MNALIEFFLQNIDRQERLVYLKARALITLLLVVSVLMAALITITFLTTGASKTVNIALSLVAIWLTLAVVRLGRYQLAADGLSVLLVLIMTLSLFFTRKYPDPYYFVIHFYLYLTFIVFASLFAQKRVFVGIIVAVFVSAATVYAWRAHLVPQAMRSLAVTGITIYLASVLFIGVTGFFFSTFLSGAMAKLALAYEHSNRHAQITQGLMVEVLDSTKHLNHTGGQLSATSHDLMSRAATQASTTEEVASAMEELLVQIDQNAQHAENTLRINREAVEHLELNIDVMAKTIDLVNQIATQVRAIGQISAQTDILAINSAIEAARAGRSGKAFMVIAAEIRLLAEETRRATDAILQKARLGTEHSHTANRVLEELTPKLNNSLAMLQSVVHSTREQRTGAHSVNSALQQLSDITNSNSAASEELSASGEQLMSQASAIHDMVHLVNQKLKA